MSLNIEERTAVVTYRLEKAERTMEQAKHNQFINNPFFY